MINFLNWEPKSAVGRTNLERRWQRQEDQLGQSLQLQPVGQIGPVVCFYMMHELKVVFMFLNGWGKKKKNNIL